MSDVFGIINYVLENDEDIDIESSGCIMSFHYCYPNDTLELNIFPKKYNGSNNAVYKCSISATIEGLKFQSENVGMDDLVSRRFLVMQELSRINELTWRNVGSILSSIISDLRENYT